MSSMRNDTENIRDFFFEGEAREREKCNKMCKHVVIAFAFGLVLFFFQSNGIQLALP